MRVTIRAGVLLALVLACAWPASAQSSRRDTRDLSAANQCVALGVGGMGTASVQVSGAYSGTVTWTVSSNDADYVAVDAAKPEDPGTMANSTTSTGLWVFPVAGLQQARACMTSYTSGAARVTLSAAATGGGGGGASGTFEGEVNVGAQPADDPHYIRCSDGSAANPCAVTLTGTNNINNIGGTVSLPTGAATAANQSTGNGHLSNLADRRAADPCFYGTRIPVPISQTTSTQLFTGTASNRTYLCSIMLNQAADSAQTFSLVSGTGTVCATSTGAMIGATSASDGLALPFAHGDGLGTIAKSDTDADNVCLLQSGTDRLSGVLTYVVAPN